MTSSKTFVYSESRSEFGPVVLGGQSLDAARTRIVESIRSAVADADADGVVVAMSGGLDSTTTAMLAVDAVGSDRVLGLGMPCHKTDRPGVSDARTIADGLGIEFYELHLRPLLDAFESLVGSTLEPHDGEVERPNERNRELGNAIARLRMTAAYYAANRRNYLVLGTANRSELCCGYLTKFGDDAADLYPIGDCYKLEVKALAGRIGVPRRIVTKEPTAGFWAGQTDAEELGEPYETIDPFLRRIIDDGVTVEDAATALGMEPETAAAIAHLVVDSAHKRTRPPTPGIWDRTAPSEAGTAND